MSYVDRSDLDDQGQVTRAEVADLLKSERQVFVRLAIDVGNSPVHVLRSEFSVGLDSEQSRGLGLRSLLLFADWIDGADASGWITSGSGQISVTGRGDVEFHLPDLQHTGTWHRLPAHAGNDTPRIDISYRRFTFSSPGGNTSSIRQQAWYVCPEGPSYPSVDAAVHGFFSRTELSSTSSNRGEVLTVRVGEPGPRIARVTFTPGEVAVALDGLPSNRRDEPLRVEVNAGGRRSRKDLRSDPWEAVFPLETGQVGEWWTVVSDGNRWFDYRRSSAIWQPSPGVEHVPPDLSADEELEAILAFGECTTAEFKQQLPRTRDAGRKICRTVAAFANGRGGAMLFGIDKDEATIVGVEESFATSRDRLTNIVVDNLTATPDIELREFNTDERVVIGLFVEPGDDTPYGVDKQNPTYYIRTNATTRPATAEQVRRFVRSRTAQGASSPVM